MFLFINILCIAAENPTSISDSIDLVDPNFQEALKDYKPNLENIDKMFNYVEKNIKEKGRAVFYSKLEKEKNEVIVTDENNNLILTMNYKNNKMIVEQQIEGNKVKMINYFDNSNPINGNLVSIMQMKNFLPEGEAKMFYPSGKLLSVSIFKNRKINGVINMYYENGKIGAVYNIKDNIQDGEAIEYDEDGNVIRKVLYKNGEIIK